MYCYSFFEQISFIALMFSGKVKDRVLLQKKFGKHLKKVLDKKGIRPIELAQRSFIDKQHISGMIHGKMNATLYTLMVICKSLDMTMDEFFEGFEY